MTMAAAFAVAAAIGAVARAEAGRRWNRHDGVPWGTLMVNLAGSFLLGLLHDSSPEFVTVLGVGGIGAFTTYSSFARDVAALVELRRVLLALAYALASCAGGLVVASIALAW